MTDPTFLAALARPLIVLHGLVALAGAGACTHFVLTAFRLWRGNDAVARVVRLHAMTVGAIYVATFALGLLAYPHYRWAVRGLYLDRYEPWASNLFDMKENFAALGLPFAVGAFVIGRGLLERRDRASVGFIALASAVIWLVVAATAVLGLIVTDVRGV